VTLARLLELAALRWPQAEAVVDGDRRLTYAQLHARARSLGAAFHRLGVAPGDRVLIALRNRLEHVLAYWALQTIAAVPTPVNFRFAPAEMQYVLDDCGARVALYESATAPAMHAASEGRDLRLIFVGSAAAIGSAAAPKGSVPFEALINDEAHSGGGGAAGVAGGPARPSASGSPGPHPDLDGPGARAIASELMLIGRTTDEARDLVEKYLDDAFMAGMANVRLVHGKGTGALRKAVRGLLSDHPLVDSYRDGEPAEGGSGATVAALKVS